MEVSGKGGGITVARNAMVLLSSSFCARFLVLAFNILLARFLGVEQFGIYAFAISFTTLLSTLAEFSLRQLIIRDVARNFDLAGSYFSNGLVLKSLSFLVAVALVPITTTLLGYSQQIQTLLYILSVGLLFHTVTNSCVALFNAMQQMRYSGALTIVEEICFTALGLATLGLGGGLTAIVFCRVIAQAVTQFTGLFLLTKWLRVRPGPVSCAICKKLARDVLPFFGVSVFTTTARNIDTVLLLSMQGPVAAGIYAAGAKLVKVTSHFSRAFSDALYPALSRQAVSQERRMLRETYGHSVKWIMITVVPFVAFATVQGDDIMRTVYGQDFVQASVVFQIFAWRAALGFLAQFCGTTLYASGRQRVVFIATGTGVITSLFLYAVLIPRYSYTGAALAVLIALVVEFFLQAPFVSQQNNFAFVKRFVWKPAAAGLVLSTFCIFFESLSLVVLAGLGSIVYVGCLVLFRSISREEVEILVRSSITMLRGKAVREVYK
jgi:O-antigen/teichoic acid export membrane protein